MTSRAATLKATWNRYGAGALSAITIAALIAYPLPFCIACEYPNPWGHVSVMGEIPVTCWVLIAPFLAGAFPMKRGWLVPIIVLAALLATQPLGGVAWWSLRENEGPIILLLGVPYMAACFGVGRLTAVLVNAVRRGSQQRRFL